MAEEVRPQVEDKSWRTTYEPTSSGGQTPNGRSDPLSTWGNGNSASGDGDKLDGFRRGPSVSFKTDIAIPGSRISKAEKTNPDQEALPRPRGRSLLAEIAGETQPKRSRPKPAKDAQRAENDHVTGNAVKQEQSRRERRGIRRPVVDTAMDGGSADGEAVLSPNSSSASNSAPSPRSEPSEIPVATMDEAFRSPGRISEPILIPESASLPLSMPYRSRTDQVERGGSLRQVMRRSTARSGSSSFSPASAFLMRYRDESLSVPSEPDDEGQAIGDDSEYIIGKQIGYGGFSVVKEVYSIEKDERVRRAVKIVRKQIIGQSDEENDNIQKDLENEVSIWRFLKHRYILPLHAVYENSFATFCIIQYNAGGTLFDLIREKRKTASFLVQAKNRRGADGRDISPTLNKPMRLAHVKRYMYQIASAVRYLHQDMRIVHRDLKLENCLLDTSASLSRSISSLSDSFTSLSSLATESAGPGDILLCDFGMANFCAREDRDMFRPSSSHSSPSVEGGVGPDGSVQPSAWAQNIGPGTTSAHLNMSTRIDGSLQYAAPELIRASQPIYHPSIDMWAYGVICFTLLAGVLPFNHGLSAKLTEQILQQDWDVELLTESVKRAARLWEETASRVDEEARDALELVRGCLDMNQETRWDIGTVLDSAFLRTDDPEVYERQDDT